MDEIEVALRVSDVGDNPSAITAIIGIEPTRSRRRGDPVGTKSQAPARVGTWVLASPSGRHAPLEDQLSSLLSLLEGKPAALDRLRSSYSVELSIAAYYTSSNPGFHLSEGLVARIATLGLSMDFDIYCLSSDDDE